MYRFKDKDGKWAWKKDDIKTVEEKIIEEPKKVKKKGKKK
jgi:hypothetical protein